MEKTPLHDLLCGVLGAPFPDGEDHCYFESPADIEIKYPCIIYNYEKDFTFFADNTAYQGFKIYKITVIDDDPDSKIPERLRQLPYCTSDRNFAVDGLSHFVYRLYYNGSRIKEEER